MTKPLFRTLPKHVQHMLRRRNREWIQDTQGDDELAWRAATAARIAELAEDGRVAVVYWGMDCDCSRWDDRVRILPARLREVMRWVDDYDRGAEGPQGWRLSRPSEAPTRSRSRDLALEAFEDGHPHIVYP